MARAALGAAAATRRPPPPATASTPSSGSAKTSRRPTSSWRSSVPDSVGQIDPQGLGELDQQRGGDRALIVLDQVQVAGGDAEPGRQRLLRQAPLGPQPPHRPADQRRALMLYNLYKFRRPLVKPATALHAARPD